MAAESIVKKSLLNAKVNLIFYFLVLILTFFSRKIFLDTLGAEFVGLTSTLQNLLGFLNLAELGIGTAIGYVLYKPLFEQNYNKINEIISVFGYLYKRIGLIILVGGCFLSCFLPLIFPNTGFELGIIYFAYFSFLISSLIGYFINYRQTLLGADQKNYVVTAYFESGNIIKVIIQMTSAYYTGSYYLWVAIEFFFGILYSFILNWKINQTYPWLKSEIRLGKKLFKKYPEVMRYTKQLFVHKISEFVQLKTMPILIYSFVSLIEVTLYANYSMIVLKINILINSFLNSTSAGIGRLIAEGNDRKIFNVFWQLFSVRVIISVVFSYSMYKLFDEFIILWIGREYLLSQTSVILIIAYFVLSLLRGATYNFLYGYGLFSDIYAPVIEFVIFSTLSILLGSFWGLNGILLASVVSLFIIVCLWKPYFLFKKGFKVKVIIYWIKFFKYLICSCFSILLSEYIVHFIITFNVKNWQVWVYNAFVIFIIILLITLILFFICFREFRDFCGRFLKLQK